MTLLLMLDARRRTVLPSVLASFSAIVVASSSVHAQSIAPKFSWPHTASADIVVTGSYALNTPTQNDSSHYRASSRFSVQPDALGLLMTSGPTTVLEGSMGPSTGAFSPDGMARIVTRYTVGLDGTYGALSDTIRWRQQIDSATAPLTQQFAALPAQMREGLSAAFSTATLDRQTSRSWSAMAGTLIGRRWTRGDSDVLNYTEVIPTMPGAQIPYRQTMRYDGNVDCPPESGGGTCWQFTSRVDIDMAAMRTAIGELLQRMGVSDPAMIDNIPIPKTTVSSVTLYDSKSSRPILVTLRTLTESAGSPTLGVAATSARLDTRQLYVWKDR